MSWPKCHRPRAMTRREQRTGTSRSGRKRSESLASGIRPRRPRSRPRWSRLPRPTTGEAGISITTDLLHLDGENIAALPLIERKESLRGLVAIEVPGLRFSDYVICGGPRFPEHTRGGVMSIWGKR